jgi:hypothetical protein
MEEWLISTLIFVGWNSGTCFAVSLLSWDMPARRSATIFLIGRTDKGGGKLVVEYSQTGEERRGGRKEEEAEGAKMRSWQHTPHPLPL